MLAGQASLCDSISGVSDIESQRIMQSDIKRWLVFRFCPASAVFVLVFFNNAFYWDLAPRIRAFFTRPSNPIEWLRATPPSAVGLRAQGGWSAKVAHQTFPHSGHP